MWSHTSTTPKCTFVAWTEKPLPIYFQKFGCQECSIVHFEQLKRGKYFTQCVCVCVCVWFVCVCVQWEMERGGARKGRPSIYSLRCMKLQRWIRLFWISWHTRHSAAPPTAPAAIMSNGWIQGLTWLGSHAVWSFYHEDGGTSFPTACCVFATINDVRSDFHSMDVRFESPSFFSYLPHPFRDSTLQ